MQLHPSGQRVAVTGEQTIVEALSLAGIETETACGIGVCGTCQARVVSGIPDHRDNYLTPAEKEQNDRILLCCSRTRSPEIVIELQD